MRPLFLRFPLTTFTPGWNPGSNRVPNLGDLSDVLPALNSCRFFVLPSYREGTPRSVLEAMSVGRPIITTDVPGCRETVVHGVNSLLVPPRDVKALAQSMLSLIANLMLILTGWQEPALSLFAIASMYIRLMLSFLTLWAYEIRYLPFKRHTLTFACLSFF